MRITTSTDPRGIGILALQHKDFDKATGHPLGAWEIHHRASIHAARVLDRNDTTLEGLGHWIYDPETVGDVCGAQLLKYDTRTIPMWRFATPGLVVPPDSTDVQTPSSVAGDTCAVLSGFSINSIEDDKWQEDKRLKTFDPIRPKRDGKDVWPKFAVDTFGISLVANKESDQVDLFFPTDPRQIAVNRKGDAAMGSLVCDMGDDFKIDLSRMARLQSKCWVLKEPKTCNSAIKTNAIAWNIGPSGCGDVRGGFIVESRALEVGTPTPSGGGGGGGAPVATPGGGGNPGDTVDFAGRNTTAPFFATPGGGMRINPDFIGPVGPGAGGIAFGGGGGLGLGAGLGPPPPVVGTAPKASGTNGKGIIALVSQFDSGPFDVGSATDKHNMGVDADGRPINSDHLSTNSYFRRDDTYDAPLEFGNTYIPPERGRYLMPTYIRYDGKPSHPHVCGSKPGLWRLESECCLRIPTDPPPVPTVVAPPVATGAGGAGGSGGGGGEPPAIPPNNSPGVPTIIPIKQWYPGRFDRYAATDMATSFPAMIFRPQNLTANSPDLRNAICLVTKEAQKEADKTVPVTARIEAFGKQLGGEWQYTQRNGTGRFVGGTASGGLVFMHPEFDITDYSDSFSRATSILPSTSTPYFVAVPGAYWASGLPVPSTGAIKTGYRWGSNSSGDLSFDQVNSSGTATTLLKLESSGEVAIKVGGSSSVTGRPKLVISYSSTSVGNVGAGEDNLKSFSLPAASLAQTDDAVHITAHGTFVNSISATLKFYFGTASTTILSAAAITADMNWRADIYVSRSSSNNQAIRIYFAMSGVWDTLSGSHYQRIVSGTATETDTAAITVKFTGESSLSTDNDITQNLMVGEFYGAP